jgi:DNA repair exonuclease SbcCD ATPase subunit
MILRKLIAKNCFKYDAINIDFKNDTNLILAYTKDTKKEIINGKEVDVEFDNYDKSNGVGKSAIIELILYSLFGKTLRGADEISKYHSGKFYVELHYDDNVIIRTQKGIEIITKVKAVIEGKEILEDKHTLYKKTDGQRIIDEMINIDREMLIFTNIFSPQNNFFLLEDGQKKDILMKLINVDYLDDIYEKVKNDWDEKKGKRLDEVIKIIEEEIKGIDKAKDNEEKCRIELSKVQQHEQGIKDWQEFKKQLYKDIQNYRDLNNDVSSLFIKLTNLKEKLKNSNNTYEDVEVLRDKLTDMKSSRSNINNKISDINVKINDIKDMIKKVLNTSECPIFFEIDKDGKKVSSVCDKLSNKEYKDNIVNKYNNDILDKNKEIDNMKIELSNINNEISNTESVISKNTKIKQEIDEDKADFKADKELYYKNKEKLDKDKISLREYVRKNKELFKYRNIKVSLQDIRLKQIDHANALMLYKQLVDKQEKLNEYKIKNDNIKKEILDLEIIKGLFGKGGLKQHAVSKVITFLENEINIMLMNRFSDTSIKISTTFDIGKRNTLRIDVIRNGNEVSFDEFSAGEKRFFEIIFQMGLYKLFKLFSNQSFNIMFFDEALDAIDVYNSSLMIDLLKILEDENDPKTIYVVSHKEYIKDYFNKFLLLGSDKDNKNSWVEEGV